MASAPTGPELLLDLEPCGPLRERVEGALRAAIRAGRVRPGDRLPASRALADELGVSRWVVVEAYAQLTAEGWLEGRVGSGTRVRVRDAPPMPAREPASPSPPARSRYDFTLGLPDVVAFPRTTWLRALQRAVRDAPAAQLGHVDPAGLGSLRAELAAYLARVRGTSASPRHVVITAGFTHGLGLIARALRAQGHRTLAVEDPGFRLLDGFVRGGGLDAVPIPVDEQGLRVDALARSGARAVVVTPAHQFPLGHVMSPDRRGELLAWARQVEGLIVEDDYDAEFRYDRRPVGALQGLDREHVIYAGTASKSLAPALRLGWLLAPAHWRRAIAEVRFGVDLGVSAFDQLALAELVRSGALDRHLRRTRQRYAARRGALLTALARELPDARVMGIAAGLHAVVLLPTDTDERALVAAALQEQVAVTGLSALYTHAAPLAPGLVLGYAPLTEHEIIEGVRRFSKSITANRRESPTGLPS